MHITSRKGLLALVVLASGCLVAACGSSGPSAGGSATSSTTTTTAAASAAGAGGPNSARRTALVACLKKHGVTLPSRPPGSGAPGGPGGSGGSGGSGGTGTGTTPRRRFFFGGGGAAANPKFRAAFQACGATFGGGARFRARLSRTAIAKYVACVRQHGYNLPDPNFSGKGPIFPANIQSKAKFQAASRACQSLLVRPPGGAPPGGASTTSGA